MTRHTSKVAAPDDGENWLTAGQAAALTGQPVTMIEWWAASKKIRTRARDLGPTIDRESLVTYIEEREARRNEPPPPRRPRAPRRPAVAPGPEWIGVGEAAEILDRKPESVSRIARQAGLTMRRSQGRLWLRREELVTLVVERDAWISWVDASALTGLTISMIARAASLGLIEQRPDAANWQPSLSRTSVLAWAQEVRKQRAQAIRRREQERQLREPPADGHQWIRSASAARVLGVHPSRIRQLVEADQLPAIRKDGRVWLRLDHVELVRAAREARQQGGSA
ncbi:hypothetical protein GCM10028801_45450 [Nocardioides maradonensis]